MRTASSAQVRDVGTLGIKLVLIESYAHKLCQAYRVIFITLDIPTGCSDL